MARAPRKTPPPTTKASPTRTARYTANTGRGEFIYLIGEKECLIKPSFKALRNVEYAMDADYFTLLQRFNEGSVKVTDGITIFLEMNEGDFVSEDEAMEHFMREGLSGRLSDVGLLFMNCMLALADPSGSRVKAVTEDEAASDPN